MKKIIYLSACILIIVSCKKEPFADFNFSESTNIGEVVQFTNLSKNSDNSSWDFGDGSTSTEKSPTHMYAKPDDYTVILTVTGNGGSATISKQIKITGISYSFKNSTTLNLYNFATFSWNGLSIEGLLEHGILFKGAETQIITTEKTEIYFGFTSEDEYVVCMSDGPLYLTIDKHNDFIIGDYSPIYCGYAKSGSINNIENILREFKLLHRQ